MRGDFSRFTPDFFNRYIGTFIQQGRVQLDSDWNENVINFLNMLRKQSRDFLGTSACVGDSFRIGMDVPIDHMLQTSVWNVVDPSHSYSPADKRGYIFLNTNDRPRTHIHSTHEKASLFVENANEIFREFNNLDLSRFRSIYVRFKVIGRTFQIILCPKCSRVYPKGEQQQDCSSCGTRLEQEKEAEQEAKYANRTVNYNISGNNDYNNQSIPTLTLRVHTQEEEDGNKEDGYEYEYEGQFIGLPDAGGFFKVKFDLLQPNAPTTSLDKHDLSHIFKLHLQWDNIEDKAVCIGLVSAEPMAVIVSADEDISKSNPWINVVNASSTSNTHTSGQDNNNSFFSTYKGKPTILKEKGKEEMSWSFSKPMNFNSLNILRFAISRSNNYYNNNGTSRDDKSSYSHPILFLVDSNNNPPLEFSLAEQEASSKDSWRYYSVSIKDSSLRIKDSRGDYKDVKKVATDDLNEIKRIGLKGLSENDVLYISEILGELDFKDNFLISGDFDLNLSSRMYVNGILCSRNNWDSYLTQKDISSASGVDYFMDYSAEINQEDQERHRYRGIQKAISYMVYADVWNRGITHLEDPEIREVALGGADTATRLQTICQIKIKEIPERSDFHQMVRLAEYEIREMIEQGTGRLSIIYPDNSSLSNPDSNHRTLGNNLYRVQIHDSGTESEVKNNNNNNKNRATFKWSKDNASLAFAVKKLSGEEVILDQGGRRLDNVFRIGDLIEIIDDIDELSEQPRGYMRRITHIDVDRRALSWSVSWSARKESEQKGIRYLHEPVSIRSERYRPELHPKVILWDGLDYVNTTVKDSSSCNVLSDEGSSGSDSALRIKFHPGSFISGHYWNFTTRSNGKVELLKSAKPVGPQHHYALLALIRKEPGKEIEIVEDLRHVFQPLTNLRAIDISYDSGNRSRSETTTTITTVQAAIQRLSEGRLRILPGHGNNNTINDLAIEAGEIYELKPVKGRRVAFASVITFNDIYQHRPLLMYTIKSNNSSSSSDVRHEIHMLATDLADQDGNVYEDPIDDGRKNYAWKGFEIEAEENAHISWLALGDSYTYFERLLKRVLDEFLLVFLGVDTDQLKEDSSILNSWHKNLRKMSDSGPDLAEKAMESYETVQKDFDRWVRNVDKQLKDVHKNFEGIFDFDNDDEGHEKKEKANRQPLRPLAQTIKCPRCDTPYPKENKYTFCTKCGAELPVQ